MPLKASTEGGQPFTGLYKGITPIALYWIPQKEKPQKKKHEILLRPKKTDTLAQFQFQKKKKKIASSQFVLKEN